MSLLNPPFPGKESSSTSSPTSSLSSSPVRSSKLTLFLLALIMLVNALSYGTIIPLLYPFAKTFGVSAAQVGFLFASYSIAQFLSTPILGRLSDRYGRKPILLLCLLGTAGSLAMMALSKTVLMLFLARLIDGLTGGNVSVAQAVISDSTKGEQRAKAFGILGAAFGFGFLFGPALGGLMSPISLTAPFWFSSALAFVAVILGVILLPETLSKENRRKQHHEPMFNFVSIYHALFAPFTGVILLISFLAATALNCMILGFQTFSIDILHMSELQNGLFFSSFGLVGILMQVFGIGLVLRKLKSKKVILSVSLLFSGIILMAAYFSHSIWTFFWVMIAFGVISSFRDPMIAALLSEKTKTEDQGIVLGMNQSYVSLGQIIGPLIAGLVAGLSVEVIFLVSAVFFYLSMIVTQRLFKEHQQKLDL